MLGTLLRSDLFHRVCPMLSHHRLKILSATFDSPVNIRNGSRCGGRRPHLCHITLSDTICRSRWGKKLDADNRHLPNLGCPRTPNSEREFAPRLHRSAVTHPLACHAAQSSISSAKLICSLFYPPDSRHYICVNTKLARVGQNFITDLSISRNLT